MKYYYNQIEGGLLNTEFYLDKTIIPKITKNHIPITKEEYEKISRGDLSIVKENNLYSLKETKNTLSKEQKIKKFYTSIKALIENKSQEYGYEDSADMMSFLNSGNMTWKSEAQSFVSWRDNTLSLLYKNINDFNEGKISSLPTVEDFVKQPSYLEINIEKASRPPIF